MKSLAISFLLASIACLSASNALAGGAMVLYFDASQDASAADGEGTADHGGSGGSGQGGAISSGGAAVSAGQAGGGGALPGGNSQSGAASSSEALASENEVPAATSEVQSGILDDVAPELENEIASNLSVPGIVDELSLKDDVEFEPVTASTPSVTDFTSEPDVTNISEIKSAPFPTGLPSVALVPAVETKKPTLPTVAPSPSGPNIETTPFGSLGPAAGPVLSKIPPAFTSSAPEPASVMVWMIGAVSFAGSRRRQRAGG